MAIVAAQPDGVYVAYVPLECTYALPRFQVPELQSHVVASRKRITIVHAQMDRSYVTSVSLKCA